MATLALGLAGAAIGGALLPSVSILGATIGGAAIGRAIGGLAGSYIDNALFGASGQGRVIDGPRLASLQVMASRDGAPMPRLYGRARIAGEVIWATNYEEDSTTTGGGGKGLGGGSSAPAQTTYSYFANFAVGLCQGPITRIGSVWADGKPLDLTGYTYRLYNGSEQQLPDSLIEAKEGAGLAPAYRGIAYVVFERMPLAKFGNRLPQLAFEVFRALDGFEQSIKAVTVIPGTGEFAYDITEVQRGGGGVWTPENTNTLLGKSDWSVAMDQLQDSLPNAANVSLVVSWFGMDLRAGNCQIKPGTDNPGKLTTGAQWSVAGLTRSAAHAVSTFGGGAAFGGTPSDHSVIAAIKDLTARGLKTTFYPFILMDVPQGNGLPDPYGGAAQAAYPWRGRITIAPAAGQAGSPDKTAAAAAQVAAFMGTATPANFSIAGSGASSLVVYSGPAEWSFRRFILHCAYLCKAAGGVDTFLIGSELRGLTTVRSGPGAYPFVAALTALAADVKSVLGAGTKVTYGADWSEYFGHQPADGSHDVYFHLDPLWASSSIDAVGIDCYWPLADWRDGSGHLDLAAGAPSVYDLGYLSANVFAGEGYEWYYASAAARNGQQRTPITDDAGKPWVFRFKDIRNWWNHQHYDRPGGVEQTTPTAWVPQGKPIWFTEVGCPAVDKGANQPNVFVDAKSAESSLPYFSGAQRDDMMQRRYLQAILGVFANGVGSSANPTSAVYGGPMVDPARMAVYTWDARPYPAFPYAAGVWGDGANWPRGHWITGRISAAALDTVVAAILKDYGFTAFSVANLTGLVEGFVIDSVMSARAALQPLELAYFFDSYESGDTLMFAQRGAQGPVAQLSPSDLVEHSPGAEPYNLVRKQETDLPLAARVSFLDADQNYHAAAAESRRLAGHSARMSSVNLPLVMRAPMAQAVADSMLQDAWASRQLATFKLPARLLWLEPSDVVDLVLPGRSLELRITALTDGLGRAVDSLSIQRGVYVAAGAASRAPSLAPAPAFGPPAVVFMDLPLLRGDEPPAAPRIAATQTPWPGAVAVYRATDGIDFRLNSIVPKQATLGVTASALAAGPVNRWDKANTLLVILNSGTLGTQSQTAVLAGANAAAIEASPGVFEVVQFVTADLVAPQTYRLGTLLRGQAGTEAAMAGSLAPGANFVLLDGAVTLLDETADQLGLAQQWRYGPANRPIGNAAYYTLTKTFTGIGRRPLSPSHVRGARSSSGLAISWKRRTRIGGDNWGQFEVPLAEDSEAYQVDILLGGNVVRTLTAATPAVTYTASQQIADFGAPPSAVTLNVYQISQSFGRGTPRAATV